MASLNTKLIYLAGYVNGTTWIVCGEGDSPALAKHNLANKMQLIGKLHDDYVGYSFRISTKEIFVYE